jgi:hypothetical protein
MAARNRSERRRSNRTLTLRTGTIMSAGAHRRKSGVACAVLDLSGTGACLLLPEDVVVPKVFTLVMDGSGERLDCTVKWQSGCRVGVEALGSQRRALLDGYAFRLHITARDGQAGWRYAHGHGLIEAPAFASNPQ